MKTREAIDISNVIDEIRTTDSVMLNILNERFGAQAVTLADALSQAQGLDEDTQAAIRRFLYPLNYKPARNVVYDMETDQLVAVLQKGLQAREMLTHARILRSQKIVRKDHFRFALDVSWVVFGVLALLIMLSGEKNGFDDVLFPLGIIWLPIAIYGYFFHRQQDFFEAKVFRDQARTIERARRAAAAGDTSALAYPAVPLDEGAPLPKPPEAPKRGWDPNLLLWLGMISAMLLAIAFLVTDIYRGSDTTLFNNPFALALLAIIAVLGISIGLVWELVTKRKAIGAFFASWRRAKDETGLAHLVDGSGSQDAKKP